DPRTISERVRSVSRSPPSKLDPVSIPIGPGRPPRPCQSRTVASNRRNCNIARHWKDERFQRSRGPGKGGGVAGEAATPPCLASALLLLQRLAQDVAEARARIGRAILRHRLLLLGDLERLDREVGLLRAVEAGDHGVELLADLEALRPLLVTVATKVAALDEAGRAVVARLDVKPAVIDREHRHRDDIALADAAGRRARFDDAAALELLHAEADALLLDIDVEHHRLHGLTLVMHAQRFLARNAPGDVGHVDHAVDVAGQADEQAELGRVLDLALDLGA